MFENPTNCTIMLQPSFQLDNNFDALEPHRAILNKERELIDLKLSKRAALVKGYDLTAGQISLAESIIEDCTRKLEALRQTEAWKNADAAVRNFKANNPVSQLLKASAGMSGFEVMMNIQKSA